MIKGEGQNTVHISDMIESFLDSNVEMGKELVGRVEAGMILREVSSLVSSGHYR